MQTVMTNRLVALLTILGMRFPELINRLLLQLAENVVTCGINGILSGSKIDLSVEILSAMSDGFFLSIFLRLCKNARLGRLPRCSCNGFNKR